MSAEWGRIPLACPRCGAGVLRRLFLALEPGGVIVLTVPAHPVLFGSSLLALAVRPRP